tara:strand:+ start:1350 stop:3170 length:1821 start_codon:yes stop_codon:yes gene_type:complete
MNIYYKKNNNSYLFDQFTKTHDNNYVKIEKIQNFIPLYKNFFVLNNNNYNNINLKHKFSIKKLTKKEDDKIFDCILDDISGNNIQSKTFIKYSPLLDPCKYMLGKYDNSYNIFDLPDFENNNNIHPKFNMIYNSAYVDSFFSYLSSELLNNYNFYNGINFYGSFLGIKHDFIVDIEDDIEYLLDSNIFNKNNNNIFKIMNNEKLNKFLNKTKYKKKLIDIYNNDYNNESYLDLHESIIDLNNKDIYSTITSEYDKNIEMLDITNNILPDISNNYKSKNNTNSKLKNKSSLNNKSDTNSVSGSESGSYCSSRTSNTSKSDSSNNDYDSECESESEPESEYESESESESESNNDSEILVSINKFPVQIICLECCDNTLDDFIMNNKINDKVWESIILQILFTLIIYQKCFDFTHNDLHTNNVVYVKTDKKYLYYKYDNVHYKVPTYGKIFKIIDFGRAAYTVNNKFIISDSYDLNGDAHTQYNCQPFYNENKSIVNPNFSFDLCRLSCSIFDYFVDDLDDIVKLKSPIKKLIISWIFDDKNRNILYKNNGDERYPDFKLYKMIARTVTKHIPSKVIKNVIFNKYNIAKKNINKSGTILNIDNLPVFVK